MTTSSNNTNSPANQQDPSNNSGYVDPAAAPPADPAAVPADPIGDMYDHDDPKAAELKKAEDDAAAAELKKIEDEAKPVEDPATGYDDKKPEAKKPDAEPAKELTPEELAAKALADADPEKPVALSKEDVDAVLGNLGEGHDVEGISKLAIDNNFSKEQVEAYVAFAKQQDQQMVTNHEERISQQKSDYVQELKDDKDFSGQNGEMFLKSVHQVEKILDNLMPNTKKKLSEGNNMLPPYMMRDILAISRTMNPKSKLVNGEPSTPVKKEDGNFLDDMYT